jgi:hypothetical protein
MAAKPKPGHHKVVDVLASVETKLVAGIFFVTSDD